MTSTIIAVVCGVIGFGAGRLVKHAALQSVVSCVLAWVLASVARTVLWLVRPPLEAEVLAVAWHLPQATLAIAVVGAVALMVYLGLAAVTSGSPAVLAWASAGLALTGAVVGAWGYPGGLGLGQPLR